jgi:hypothetical protein
MGTLGKHWKLTEETKKRQSKAKKGFIPVNGFKTNEKHWNWKGEKVSYSSLHHWINKKLGHPGTCEFCGVTGLWGKKIHWANKDHKYKRILSDWLRLCAKCHIKYDKQL